VTADYRLLPLACASCGAPLAAEGTDLVFYCTACRSGYFFDPAASGGLVPIAVAFVAAPAAPVARHLPFWLLPARIRILERSASGGSLSSLLGFFLGGKEATGSEPGEGTFAIPAFEAPLDRVVNLAERYTQELPVRAAGSGDLLGERLTGGSCDVADARRLAEFVLIATEVSRGDTVKSFRYELAFGEPRLLGVPFVRRDEGLVDALFGLLAGRP
jgi:hypothetical protein